MLLSEHVHCGAITFKMTERVEQQIYLKFCIKLEHSSAEDIRMIQKAEAMGNWWLAASSWQCACSCIMSRAEFLAKHQITQVTLLPYSPDLVPCDLAFPKTKIAFERKDISDHWWNSRYDRAANGDWENCVRSQGAYLEGDWVINVLCILFLVSSSISASIFHIIWLDTF